MNNTPFSEQILHHTEETDREKRNACRLAMIVLIVVVIFFIVFSL